jgi:hypothetical protein
MYLNAGADDFGTQLIENNRLLARTIQIRHATWPLFFPPNLMPTPAGR